MEKIQAPISLSRFSAIQISKCIWKQKDIITLLEYHVKKKLILEMYHTSRLLIPTANKLSTLVASKICALNLPKSIEKEVRFVIGEMGTVLILWINNIKRILHDNQETAPNLKEYINHMHWTPNGLIDSSKTLRSLYASKKIPQKSMLPILCYHCVEDCILDCWLNLAEPKQFSSYETILTHYWHCNAENRMLDFQKCCAGVYLLFDIVYNPLYSIKGNMFLICFGDHNLSGMTYFWELLNNNEKQRIIAYAVRTMTRNFENPLPSLGLNDIDETMESDIIIFYVEKLLNYERQDLLIELCQAKDILSFFLTWPYQDSFVRIFEECWDSDVRINYHGLLFRILEGIAAQITITTCDTWYHEMFCELWQIAQPKFGNSIHSNSYIFNYLIILRDAELIKFFVNSEHSKSHRMMFLEKFRELFTLPMNRDFLEEFIRTVLTSDCERIWFRDGIRLALFLENDGNREFREHQLASTWWYKIFFRPFRSLFSSRKFKRTRTNINLQDFSIIH